MDAVFSPVVENSFSMPPRVNLQMLLDKLGQPHLTGALPFTLLGHAVSYALELKFHTLAEKWRKETRFVSSLSRIVMHPSYQAIIGMGEPAVPLILREMKNRGGHWLWALHSITGEDPAGEGDNFKAAVQAWLTWGLERGYVD